MTRKINQIAIVVKDIETSINFYQDFMNLGPFQIIDRPKEECELHGKTTQFRLKTAFAMNEGLQIELIQVIEGKTAHSEFLDQHGPGIHHVGYYIENLEEEIKKFLEIGVEIISRGESHGVKWAYFDTQSLSGVIQEFIELPKPKPRKKRTKPL